METVDNKLSAELVRTTAEREKDSPLKMATDPVAWLTPDLNMVDSPPRLTSNVTISSILKISLKNRSFKNTPNRYYTTGGEIGSPTKRLPNTMWTELPNLLSETEMTTNISTGEMGRELGKDTILPLKLFELSLESPSISRPSIDLPSTFSKLPSTKKRPNGKLVSSQESVFVAATQFSTIDPETPLQNPVERNLDDRPEGCDLPEESSSPGIPPTQYPQFQHRSLATYNQAPILSSSIKTIQCSQPRELFGTTSPTVIDGDYTSEIQFDEPDVANLSVSDKESNPFAHDKDHGREGWFSEIPSAMKKKTSAKSYRATPPQKRVKFALIADMCSGESIAHHSLEEQGNENLVINEKPFVSKLSSVPLKKRMRIGGEETNDAATKETVPKVCNNLTSCSVYPSTVSHCYRPLVPHDPFGRPTGPLSEQMLVWARWRPQYYSTAILQNRTSKTRELWKVRFTHWRGSARSISLSADYIVVYDINSLREGDLIYVVRNRKKMQVEQAIFIRWLDLAKALVKVESDEELIELQKVVLSRATFVKIQQRQNGLFSESPSYSLDRCAPHGKRTKKNISDHRQ